MTKVEKITLTVIVILAFISGYFLNSGSKEAEKQMEALRKKERQMFTQQIIKKQVEIQQITERQNARAKRWHSDSLNLAEAVKAQKRITAQILKDNESINYQKYSNPDLDSIDAILFRPR